MRNYFFILLCLLCITSCDQVKDSLTQVKNNTEQENIDNSLHQYEAKNWQLIEAFDKDQKPLFLESIDFKFDAINLVIKENTIYLQGICSPFHVSFTQKEPSVIMTDVINYDNAVCDNSNSLKAGQNIVDFFNRQQLSISYGNLNDRLIFSNPKKDTLVFKELSSETVDNDANITSNIVNSTTAYMEIKPAKSCDEKGNCFLVREIFYDNQFQKTYSEWLPLDFEIENLHLSPDFNVTIKLNIFKAQDPNIKTKYVLDKVLEQTPIKN
ncbi:hypothetical protein GKC56_05695 [Neisseriaceae bacterium PsAf]|nr:hypothetical protein [Neisseriaceae bacterium PsAf]MCV2503450.1 hypothetical protein [Neisseriaceae bacterium]